MLRLVWLIPFLPLSGFVALGLAGRRMPRWAVSLIGVGSVGLSAAFAVALAVTFSVSPPPGGASTETLFTWIGLGGLDARVAFFIDPLAIVMCLVVTVVGFLIHLYSSRYMEEDEGFSRFFAWMNLFVGSMLILVLADDLVLLYLGWEGVGLCSYLLIGFWYRETGNAAAARKAFIVTRVGDTAMAIGLFYLFTQLGTLRIQDLMSEASARWGGGGWAAAFGALLLLGGAVGKSAQLPLQTWLPDAMAGPTPVSALIHAATMVAAGVYLIARTHVLFSLAPAVLVIVAVIGALTLLLAGFSALTQRDIKRILAYSTISQIGYMFLALGVGAWSAAIFHLMTHAFFKSLLFLGAGAVILALDGEHDVYRMGGLRRRMPVVFWTMLAAAGSLSAVPLVTAGFYSKDRILAEVWSSGTPGSGILWLAGVAGALLTSLYIFRLIFLVFFREEGKKPGGKAGLRMLAPMTVLAVLSIVGGFVETPGYLGGVQVFPRILETSFGASPSGAEEAAGPVITLVAVLCSLGGIVLAYLWYLRRGAEEPEREVPVLPPALYRFWLAGWGFDALYNAVFVRPYRWLSERLRRDPPDRAYDGVAGLCRAGYGALRRTQNGRVRWYAAGIITGAALILGIVVFFR